MIRHPWTLVLLLLFPLPPSPAEVVSFPSGKPRRGKSFRFCRFFSPILRWRVRFERMNETTRDRGYFIDSRQERGLICSRRFVKAADFSHELKRGILNFFGSDGRIKVEKWFDVSAHSVTSVRLTSLV